MRCNLLVPRELALRLAAADTDDVVVSIYRSIPSVLTRCAGCAYTRAPASTHVADAGRPNTSDGTATSACGCAAPFACSKKDVQSVGRELHQGKERRRGKTREKEGRAGVSEANERNEGEKGEIHVTTYRYGIERGHSRATGRARDIHLAGERNESTATAERGRAIPRESLALVVVVEK